VKTKERIVHAAIELFSKKGFTETSVREIAAAVGVNESSLYNHFDSKGAILQYILENYQKAVREYQGSDAMLARLTKDATPDDIIACIIVHFPPEKENFFLKTLHVLLQEQFRNEAIRNYVANDMILWNERYVSRLLQRLIALGVLDESTDIDYWAKLHVSLNYKFTARRVMGIGEIHPKFCGKGDEAMKRKLYETLFSLHGTKHKRGGELMLEQYFSNNEIAEELGIPIDSVKDLLEHKMELNKTDVDKLLRRMAKKLSRQ